MVANGAAHHARWPAALFGADDHHGTDHACDLSPGLTAKVEAAIGRYKRVIGDALRSRTDETQATEVAIATAVLNRMLGLARPNYVRIV